MKFMGKVYQQNSWKLSPDEIFMILQYLTSLEAIQVKPFTTPTGTLDEIWSLFTLQKVIANVKVMDWHTEG